MESPPTITERNHNRAPQDAASTDSVRAALASRMFAFLEQRGVPYVLVGDVRDFDHSIASDLDIVVAEEALPITPRVLADFAAANDGRLVQAIRHERAAYYFVLAHRVAGRIVFVHPDVCTAYVRRGRSLMTAEELLLGRRSAPFGGFVPSPAAAFGYYFMKKIGKGTMDGRAFMYLCGLWGQDRAGCLSRLERVFPRERASLLTRAFDQIDLDVITASLGELRQDLERVHPITWTDRCAELRRAVDRWLRPTGTWVAFYGPDGAGKSSVIARIEERLAPAFRRSATYHLRPYFGQRSSQAGTPTTAPHGLPVRSTAASLAKAVYWFLDATVGYWFGIRPQLVRSTLVLFDRYVDDLVVDPKRYRFGAPAWIAEALRRAAPRPDVTVVLDAPADVLQARKAEVPPAESERQRHAYRSLADRSMGAVVVDASRPLADVVEAVEAVLLDRLAERVAGRLAR